MKKGFVSCLLFMCLGMAGCQQKDVEIRIIPQPQSVETTSGTYRLQKQATFTSNLPETEGKEFAEYVQASPLGLQLSTEESEKAAVQFVIIAPGNEHDSTESYQLEITSKGIDRKSVV